MLRISYSDQIPSDKTLQQDERAAGLIPKLGVLDYILTLRGITTDESQVMLCKRVIRGEIIQFDAWFF